MFVHDLAQLFDSKITVKLFAYDVKLYIIIINDIVDAVILQKVVDALVSNATE